MTTTREQRLRELSEKWHQEACEFNRVGYHKAADTAERCASELDAMLAAAPQAGDRG